MTVIIKGSDEMETNQKYNYTCPICGYTFEADKAEMEDRTCEKCQKGTYTIRSFASIRKVFKNPQKS